MFLYTYKDSRNIIEVGSDTYRKIYKKTSTYSLNWLLYEVYTSKQEWVVA